MQNTTMTIISFTKSPIPFHPQIIQPQNPHHQAVIKASSASSNENPTNRRTIVTTLLTTALALGLQVQATPTAVAENWGTRSFLRERFFEPNLSPEDSAARIRQTAQGLHSMRSMLESKAWRYVIFYIRLKSAYLSQDMKNAMPMVPQIRRKAYVETANELVDNMAELDYYVRTPKVYESYVYYEKTLKSLDDLVALLA